MTLANRTIASTNRTIRQRCTLKYSKRGKIIWDKWIDYDCIFASTIDADGRNRNQLELYLRNNPQESHVKVIDLTQLQSLTYERSDPTKKDPQDIIIFKIDGKRHRLGFDNLYDYNQCKTLLDGIFNSTWDMTNRHHADDTTTVNMLYESVTAMRYRVHFADIETQEALTLPNGECELISDVDKLVLEQRGDKQYTFPRSSVRTISLVNNNEIQFELGSRAPVSGPIRFRFDTVHDARTCYSQWNEGVTPLETSSRESSGRHLMKTPIDQPILPPRIPIEIEASHQPPRPPPRSLSLKTPYYNSDSNSTPSSPTGSQNTYTAFQTLV